MPVKFGSGIESQYCDFEGIVADANVSTWDVTLRAPGHDPKTVRVTLNSGTTLAQDIVLEPTAQAAVLTATGAPRIGTRVDLDLSSPDDAGRLYFLPVGLSDTPPIVLGSRTIPLAPSFLLDLELSAPTIFVNVFGSLDGTGAARGQFAIPSLTSLIGLDFYFAGLTFKPSFPFGIRGISNNVKLTVTN